MARLNLIFNVAQGTLCRMRLRLGLLVALAAVVVLVAIVLSGGDDTETPAPAGQDGTKEALALYDAIPQAGIFLGDPKAKATLIEFADLQCPFCGQYSTDVMPTVVEQYVRPGTIRYELRIRSFLGEDSIRAAGAAAAAAKENRLYQFVDLFYRRQGPENSGYVTASFLQDVARAAGVDPAAAVAAAADAKRQPLVLAAERTAIDIGSGSTPDFFLRVPGGRLVPVEPGDLTPQAMTEALDEALLPQ
jgi:protein-disulfide isomerase